MKALPLGVDSFTRLIKEKKIGEHYYYVDKTLLIRALASAGGEVHLIPRPRRFGKSSNLDMIRQFVDINADKSLFDGLKISEDRAFCKEFQGQHPVLYFNMQGIKGLTFTAACEAFSELIMRNMSRYYGFLKTSPYLSPEEQDVCSLYADKRRWKDKDGKPAKSLTVSELKGSLENLSIYLEKHYSKKVVVLIDEYDVPLSDAWINDKSDPGYYKNMTDLVQGVFTGLLKTNDSLAFGVVTGCMRIARESIFTGMNNLTVWDFDKQFDQEYFGFTESEVKAMLDYYGIPGFYDNTKEWYDGFNFGGDSIYCPWDVVQYVDNCISARSSKEPQAFWSTSSGNDILTDLLQRSTIDIQQKYLKLMKGESIKTIIMYEMTYRDLERASNIWSFMVATGYLKVISKNVFESEVMVPNLELRKLMGNHLSRWIIGFSDENVTHIQEFCDAFPSGNVKAVISSLTSILGSMIHLQDQRQSGERRESLYQGIILGLLYFRWNVKSNLESGDGYCDVCFAVDKNIGVAIEMKDPGTDDLEKAAASALDQIKKKHYTQELLNWGCTKIFMYGIACRFHSVSAIMEIYNTQPNSGQSSTP